MSSFAFLWPTAACVDHRPGALRDARRARSDGDAGRRGPLRDAAAVAGAARLHLPGRARCWSASITSTHRAAPRRSIGRALGALVLPLFSLIVLLLPFTPVLPDRWPVLQALAGPARRDRVARGRRAAGVGVVAVAADHGARDRALERHRDHDRDLRVDRGRRRARRAAADRHHALSIRRRAALPGDRAEPVA